MAAIVSQSLVGTLAAKSFSRPDGFAEFSGLRATTQKVAAPSAIQPQRRRDLRARAATVVTPKYTTMKPLGDRVLVRMETAEEMTAGGILLPTAAQTKPQGGEVISVGEGRTIGDKKIPVDIQVGAKIVYSKFAGSEVQFNGKTHLLLKEDDMVGMLTTDDIKDLKPLNDRVLIKVLGADSKTAGGVLLTESAKEKPSIGEIVAVGPGSLGEDGSRKPIELKAGNTVLYSKFGGSEFKSADGTVYMVMRSSDVMAVLS